jgi:hypothetical protein
LLHEAGNERACSTLSQKYQEEAAQSILANNGAAANAYECICEPESVP